MFTCFAVETKKCIWKKNQGQLDILEIYKDKTYVKGISDFRKKIMVLQNYLYNCLRPNFYFLKIQIYGISHTEIHELTKSVNQVRVSNNATKTI